MKETLDEAEESVVVFATDEVPREICRTDSANVMVRKYLGSGGRIVWVEDVPFWSVNEREDGFKEKWRIGLPQQMLGVYPLMAESSERVSFCGKGEDLLSEKWFGERPIAVKKQDGRWTRLFEKPTPFNDFNVLSYSTVWLNESSWNITFLQRVIEETEVSVSKGGGVDATFVKGEATKTITKTASTILQEEYLVGEYANAWQLVFSSEYEQQGFYRIWDNQFGEITGAMLNDLYNVATHGLPIES